MSELPPPRDDIAPWITLTLSSSWRNLVNCAIMRDSSLKPVISPKQRCDEHQCSECGRQFASYPELQGHKHRVHGYKNPLRQYMPTSTCLCCLKQFGSRPRLLCHLQAPSKRCADFLFKYFRPLDREISDALDRHDLSQTEVGPWRQQAGPSLQGSIPCDRYLTITDVPDSVRATLST